MTTNFGLLNLKERGKSELDFEEGFYNVGGRGDESEYQDTPVVDPASSLTAAATSSSLLGKMLSKAGVKTGWSTGDKTAPSSSPKDFALTGRVSSILNGKRGNSGPLEPVFKENPVTGLRLANRDTEGSSKSNKAKQATKASNTQLSSDTRQTKPTLELRSGPSLEETNCDTGESFGFEDELSSSTSVKNSQTTRSKGPQFVVDSQYDLGSDLPGSAQPNEYDMADQGPTYDIAIGANSNSKHTPLKSTQSPRGKASQVLVESQYDLGDAQLNEYEMADQDPTYDMGSSGNSNNKHTPAKSTQSPKGKAPQVVAESQYDLGGAQPNEYDMADQGPTYDLAGSRSPTNKQSHAKSTKATREKPRQVAVEGQYDLGSDQSNKFHGADEDPTYDLASNSNNRQPLAAPVRRKTGTTSANTDYEQPIKNGDPSDYETPVKGSDFDPPNEYQEMGPGTLKPEKRFPQVTMRLENITDASGMRKVTLTCPKCLKVATYHLQNNYEPVGANPTYGDPKALVTSTYESPVGGIQLLIQRLLSVLTTDSPLYTFFTYCIANFSNLEASFIQTNPSADKNNGYLDVSAVPEGEIAPEYIRVSQCGHAIIHEGCSEGPVCSLPSCRSLEGRIMRMVSPLETPLPPLPIEAPPTPPPASKISPSTNVPPPPLTTSSSLREKKISNNLSDSLTDVGMKVHKKACSILCCKSTKNKVITFVAVVIVAAALGSAAYLIYQKYTNSSSSSGPIPASAGVGASQVDSTTTTNPILGSETPSNTPTNTPVNATPTENPNISTISETPTETDTTTSTSTTDTSTTTSTSTTDTSTTTSTTIPTTTTSTSTTTTPTTTSTTIPTTTTSTSTTTTPTTTSTTIPTTTTSTSTTTKPTTTSTTIPTTTTSTTTTTKPTTTSTTIPTTTTSTSTTTTPTTTSTTTPTTTTSTTVRSGTTTVDFGHERKRRWIFHNDEIEAV